MEEFKIGDKVRSKKDHYLMGIVSELSFDYLFGGVDQKVTVMVMSEEGHMKYETFNACDIEKINEEKETKEMTSYKVGDIVEHPLYNESIITDISEFETGYISIMPLTGTGHGQMKLVSIDNVKLADDKLIISIEDYNKMANTIEKLKVDKQNLSEANSEMKFILNLNKTFKHNSLPEVKSVLYHKPATIIFWKDGTKTVVKAQNKEKYDNEKGFVMAYLKKILGNEGNYYEVIKRWTDIQ